jgi:hypothetical protein
MVLANKILLRDIQALTFHRNKLSSARRTSPVPQLTCVGGDACKLQEYLPDVVQCTNVGWDGVEVQWKCTAELEDHVRLGETTVACEGYSSRNDPYVLTGSCGLEYSLHTTAKYRNRNQQSDYDQKWDFNAHYDRMMKHNNYSGSSDMFVNLIYLTWAIMAIVGLIMCCTRGNANTSGYEEPPPYDPHGHGIYEQPKPTIPPTNNPPFGGFLSGFLAGGAAGHLLSYLRGNRNRDYSNSGLGRNSRYDRSSTVYGNTRRRESPSREPLTTETSSVRTSTGYGGTRRR